MEVLHAGRGEVAVELRECAPGDVQEDAWDRFVLDCGGSFLGSWRVVRTHRLRGRLRLFELYVPSPAGPVKVGQCAVAVRRGQVRFLDRVHLRPGYRHLGPDAWERIVERLGPALYRYGSQWNHGDEPPVHAPRATFQVDRVDLAAWPDFAAYRKSVSENIRRDHRRAAGAAARVVTRFGLDALRDVVPLTRLRGGVMRRHQEPFSEVADYVRHALKLACLGPRGFVATAWGAGRCRAAFLGTRFGDRVYHLAGGTESSGGGFGSYLFLSLLEGWFAEHPAGSLYLGSYPEPWDPATYDRGTLLYRRKLRATAVPGVHFSLRVGTGREPDREAQPGATARSALR